MINTENIHKLATKEDPYHIHKFFGSICFINFIYQFLYVLSHRKTHMDNSIGVILMGVHAILPISSLIFHIPNIRNQTGPMIYPEFRLHSIIFSLRSIICFYLCYYQTNIVYRMGVCILTMISADIATYMTSHTSDKTLIRAMPFNENVPLELQKKIKIFQSSCQIGATLYMLGNTHTTFLTLYGIQLAAFLMTLVRKNIIKPNIWHRLYCIFLIFSVFGFYTLPISFVLKEVVLYLLFIEVRFSYNLNKYIAWPLFFALYFAMTYLYNISHIDPIMQVIEHYIKHGLVLYYIIQTRKYIL